MPENFNLNSDFSDQNSQQGQEMSGSQPNHPISPQYSQPTYEPPPQMPPYQQAQQQFQQPSGQFPNQPFGQVPPEQYYQQIPEQPFEPRPEQKFAPPPSNVFIRTSESDLERIKAEGGTMPGIEPSEPFIPSDGSNAGFQEFSPESTPSGKKKNFVPLIIIAILIIAGGLLGYFYLVPLLFGEKETMVTTTTTTETTTTTTIVVSSPYPQISGPFQKSVFNVEISGPLVVEAIKSAAVAELSSPDTFKILIPKVHDDPLTNEEVVLSLIPQLPQRLHPYFLARKYLVYVYYGEVNPSLGLIVDIGEENKAEVKSVFLAWEKNLGILNDLKNFFLVNIPAKKAKEFQEAANAEAEIRYFPYPGEEMAISYGFVEQYIVISSSLESVNSAISHLRGVTEPIYP
ncbi:MAG: hypothetical protein PHF45_02150 [Candidatus Pacebacteria bacterium]|nr:hypothetical protein [Candidatus Paceibacterota bacterium]